jgi:hypothetical protein
MAKKKKREEVDRSTQIKLQEIASILGTRIETLLEEYGDPKTIVEKYERGEIQLLNE